MAFSDQESNSITGFLKKTGGIVLLLVAAAVGKGLAHGAISYYRTSPPIVRAEIQSKVEQDPDLREVYSELRRDFPKDYEQFITVASSAARESTSERSASQAGFLWMRNFVQSRRDDLAHAPAADLLALRGAYIDLMRQLEKDSTLACGDFITVGLEPGETMTPAVKTKAAHVSALTIHAISDGRDAPVPRERATDGDWSALVNAMRHRGISEDQIGHLANSTLAAMPADDRCSTGVALYEAMGDIKTASTLRIAPDLYAPES